MVVVKLLSLKKDNHGVAVDHDFGSGDGYRLADGSDLARGNGSGLGGGIHRDDDFVDVIAVHHDYGTGVRFGSDWDVDDDLAYGRGIGTGDGIDLGGGNGFANVVAMALAKAMTLALASSMVWCPQQ